MGKRRHVNPDYYKTAGGSSVGLDVARAQKHSFKEDSLRRHKKFFKKTRTPQETTEEK